MTCHGEMTGQGEMVNIVMCQDKAICAAVSEAKQSSALHSLR